MSLSGWRRVRLRERVLLWLLPALVFRALIPAGFMPADGHGLLLELCSAQGFGALHVEYGPAGAAGDHAGDGARGHSPCAFAASATVGPAPIVAAVFTAAPAVIDLAAEPASPVLPPASSLRPQPRAPPCFA